MNDDEKFEVIRDHVRGRTGYLACAWVLSILWCAWCLLFVLTWLFQADNSEELGFDPKDWVKAFAVSSAFDFVVFTPLVIASGSSLFRLSSCRAQSQRCPLLTI